MPMAQEARKPIFHLSSADGALGSHAQASLDARAHFRQLAEAIGRQCELGPPGRIER